MRALASSLLALALIAFTRAPLPAQSPDSGMVGRWFGRAELTAPWAQRELAVRLDVQPGGGVTGTIGDATLVDGRLFPDSRVARSLGLARATAIEGRLSGSILRTEGVHRERVYLTLDRVLDRMVGELQTSGTIDGPASTRVLTARVTLERVGAMVAMLGGSARLTLAHVDARPLSP
jgi:hypothetical protein